MKLKTLVVANLIAVFLIAGIAIALVLEFRTFSVFREVERKGLQEKNQQIVNIVDNEINQLVSFVRDWGVWDDSFHFMEEENEAYIRGNLVPATMENVKTVGILYLDVNFRCYHSYTTPEREPLFQLLVDQIQTQKSLILSTIESGSQQLLLYNNILKKYFWVAVQPIEPSAKDQPANGYLVFMQLLDNHFIDRISKIFGSSLSIVSFTDEQCSDWEHHKEVGFYCKNAELLNPENALLRVCFADKSRNHRVCFQTKVMRSLNLQARKAFSEALILITLCVVIIVLLTIYILDRLIVRPTQHVSTSFAHIARAKGLDKRLKIVGPFEIRELANSANHMLNEIEQLHIQLQDLARTDSLTRLCNRRYFDEMFAHEMKRSIRDSQYFGLLMIDIDFFKLYNDHYGHGAGDECLFRVAEILKTSTQRPTDIVARIGGEEFIILACNTPLSGLENLCQKIKHAFVDADIKHEFSSVADHVTCSIGGVSIIPQQDMDGDLLLKRADELLYEAKGRGRNCFVLTGSL
ncbi:MAG: diguanylate cyclase [Desulfocapsa sp.]|nr:diguanylate cyclase [Desulfocapsa sp.]